MSEKLPLVRTFWHELYIELLSSPTDHRTDREFCEENKIHVNTLGTWKRNHRKELFDEVNKRRGQYINEVRSNAWKYLEDKMKKDVNAIKLVFQLTGDLVEQSKQTHEFMSREDKMERINNLLKEANEKQKTWERVQAQQREQEEASGASDIGSSQHGDKSVEGSDASR